MASQRFCLPIMLSLALALGCHAGAAAAGDTDQSAGDILQIAVPVTAIGIAWLKDDSEGEKEWLRSTLVSQSLTFAAKAAFNHTSLGRRPNDGSEAGESSSFPSGHTAAAASGAAFLAERYGWRYGAPAWALTGFVAWNRVQERQHHWRDVAAGAALSWGVGKLFVTPQNATHVAPVVGPDWFGLRFERSF